MHKSQMLQYKSKREKTRRLTEEIQVPKQKSPNKLRQSMPLPRKTLFETNFSNERLNDALKTSQLAASLPQKTPESKHQKTFSFVLSPKQDLSRKTKLSFDDFVTTKNTFRKILKHNSIKSQNKIKNKPMIWSKPFAIKSKRSFFNQTDQPTFQMKKCLQLSAQNSIRKTYHDKFQKTRLIFQEEEKMKKIDRINKIYERKSTIFNKMNKSEDMNQLIKARQSSKRSRQIRHFDRHQIYEISENGQEIEKSI